MLRGKAYGVPSLFEPVMDGVYVVRDDNGQWGGNLSLSITHQNSSPYLAKKVLDLSNVPADIWRAVKAVRLSAHFMVRDYSWHDNPPANGLDEAFEIIVNGKIHRYPTNCGAPVYAEGKAPTIAWYDFPLPKEEFVRGANEIILHKAESSKNDDYFYLGIDHSTRRGNSFVSFDGKNWTQEKLTIPGGNGEYMVRLYLLLKDTRVKVEWKPGAVDSIDDPAKLIKFAGARYGERTSAGLKLRQGASARLEWHPLALDLLEAVEARVEGSGVVVLSWLDEKDKPANRTEGELPQSLILPPNPPFRSSGLIITAASPSSMITRVVMTATLSIHPLPKMIDICPPCTSTRLGPARRPSLKREGDVFILTNTGLECRFQTKEHLRLTSLFNQATRCEMLLNPHAVYLFLVEVEGKRFAGSRDFRCLRAKPVGRDGFEADLLLEEWALSARFAARMESEGLRLGLNITNVGKEPIHFKLAFPHLTGLTASGRPAEDYYFFPWGGGIIADTPALIRRGYGDHEALYQVMDLFSPSKGGGFYVRIDDAEGWHKILALRKHIPDATEVTADQAGVRTAEEFKWTNSLEPVEGTGIACEYLRRTRQRGGSFSPADAILAAHPGDWHYAMRAYSAWAHRVWKFRPYPSRLESVHNMIAAGWGHDYLFRDGRYRTDIIQPALPGIGHTMTDCIELMSWWEWSPLGPWSTPFDRLSEVLTPGQMKMWEPYFVKDPVTGQMMWNNQPGDYDGYNERFGGLPAFRQAIQTYKEMGALVTLYTDPFRLDDASKTGKAHGREWGVVDYDGKHTTAYEVWNPCHDNPDVRRWVADTMKRVMRETGADGIRLDEYGHKGWACFSDLHKHTFAERGVSQWMKATAEATRLVRAAMDEVSPGSVLTTEHPGYDYLLPFLEGCITYDLTVQASPLRPLEVNTQRFYFPECKAYELDHRGADPECKKRFWNAVECFGKYYPINMYIILSENEDVFQSRTSEPLIPTLRRYVYANQFSGGGKTFYHLYNACGHTVEAPVLKVELQENEHLFDMLEMSECVVRREGNTGIVTKYLGRNDIACIAKLQKRLVVTREDQRVAVTVTSPPPLAQLVLSDNEGRRLYSQDAVAGRNEIDLAKLPQDVRPACVKLMQRKTAAAPRRERLLLLDIAAIPER